MKNQQTKPKTFKNVSDELIVGKDNDKETMDKTVDNSCTEKDNRETKLSGEFCLSNKIQRIIKEDIEDDKFYTVIFRDDVREFVKILRDKIKGHSSFRVVDGRADKQRIKDFTEGENIGREMERELVLKILNKLLGEKFP